MLTNARSKQKEQQILRETISQLQIHGTPSEQLRLSCEGKTRRNGGWNVPDLRRICIDLGLSSSGRREHLLERLCNGYVEKSRLAMACKGLTWSHGGYNIKHLKKQCCTRGLPSTGTRQQLLDRLCSASTSPIPTDMVPPPHFSLPTPLACEGYWSDTYAPQVCKSVWSSKDSFLQLVREKEAVVNHISYRGMARSRIDGTDVGSGEFVDEDKGMCWPEGYADHYIGKYNVMPTSLFYNYIIDKKSG